MKKFLCIILSLVLALSFASCSANTDPNAVGEKADLSAYTYPTPDKKINMPDTKDVSLDFLASSNGYFYQNQGKKAELFYVKGVNIGLTEAQTSLDNPNVSYDTYMRWFSQISDMGANTVRAFTSMNPNFYKALYDFNNGADSPLYLIQGIWFDENYMYDLLDAWESDGIIISAFKKAIKEVTDIVHGNSADTVYGEFSPAVYKYDVSKYVIGYVLGLEYPADFVIETNASHPDKTAFSGKYLKTKDGSSPFEVWLATVGDYLIDNEMKSYNHQTPVAFLNWQVLDTIEHPEEPYKDENDAVSVNTENISATDNYYAGLFAAVDVYPYYPEFMNYEEKYTSYRDENGEQDTFRAYLNDLKTQYSVPLLVAEYGLSTSRGKAHLGKNGYDQGGLNEQQQATLVQKMTNDIALEGCAGGLVFEWADEWFKNTWNTVMYYPDTASDRTQNLSSAEQGYGIMQFNPSTVYPDGDISEWLYATEIDENIKVQYDANYMHLLVTLPSGFDPENGTLYLPISVLQKGSDAAVDYGLAFNQNADFLLVLNGKKNTRLLTDAAEDVFHYKYGVIRKVFGESQNFECKQNSGSFRKISTFVSNEIVLPSSGETIEPRYYEGGCLTYGNANPDSDSYNSLADFCFTDDGKAVEIRLPWYLLNVMNPITKTAISVPFKDNEIGFEPFSQISVGMGTSGKITLKDAKFTGVKSTKPEERLKKSYYSLQAIFNQIPIAK